MQEKNTILEFLDSMRLITLGLSGVYAYREDCLRRDALPIEIVSVRDVFTEYEISTILRVINPKVKQCYKNAFLLSSLFPDRVEYCEGLYTDYAFEHAFNKVGDVYVDITAEFPLEHTIGRSRMLFYVVIRMMTCYFTLLKPKFTVGFTFPKLTRNIYF